MSEKGPHVAGCGLAVGETDQEERERERTQGWRGERGGGGGGRHRGRPAGREGRRQREIQRVQLHVQVGALPIVLSESRYMTSVPSQ